MKRIIAVSFLLMGLGYYELSGGADFVPETRPGTGNVADAGITRSDSVPEIVTRADTTALVTLGDVSGTGSPILAEPLRGDVAAVTLPAGAADAGAGIVAAPQDPAPELAAAPVADLVADPVAATETDTVAAAQVAVDIRQVAGDRVNLRDGPGTGFGVIDTVLRGTEAEVIETGADGWVRVRMIGNGTTGWIAARLLSGGNG